MPKRIPLLLSCALLIAACGSSSSPGSSASGPGSQGGPKDPAQAYSQALQFSKCMRQHGLPNFPDPTSSGGGVQLSLSGAGANPSSPAFQAAQRACQRFQPGIGKVSARASAQARARLLQTAECMRAHGISGFPDPQTGTPPSNPSGYSAIMGTPGGYIALPQSINPQSPAFQQAASACKFGPRGGGDLSRAGGGPKGP